MATSRRFIAKSGIDNNTNTIINVSDPVNDSDAATKNFSKNASNLSTGTISATILGNSGVLTTSGNAIPLTGGQIISSTLITSNNNVNQVVDTFDLSTYRSAKYLVQVTSGTSYQSLELLLLHDGTNTYLSEYGNIITVSSLATFTSDISGSNVRLLTTPTNASTTIKVIRTAINITNSNNTPVVDGVSQTIIGQMLIGHRSGMILEYNSVSSFYINVGKIHINNGSTSLVYNVPTKLTKSVTGLSASTWYHVYANPPSSGLDLTETEISYSTTAPSIDDTKGGKLYHPSDGTKRCIGWIYSDGSSNITRWNQSLSDWRFSFANTIGWTSLSPSNTFTDAVQNVPIGSITVHVEYALYYINSSGRFLLVRYNGATGISFDMGAVYSGVPWVYSFMSVPVDSNKIIEFAWDAATTNRIDYRTLGFYLPSSL